MFPHQHFLFTYLFDISTFSSLLYWMLYFLCPSARAKCNLHLLPPNVWTEVCTSTQVVLTRQAPIAQTEVAFTWIFFWDLFARSFALSVTRKFLRKIFDNVVIAHSWLNKAKALYASLPADTGFKHLNAKALLSWHEYIYTLPCPFSSRQLLDAWFMNLTPCRDFLARVAPKGLGSQTCNFQIRENTFNKKSLWVLIDHKLSFLSCFIHFVQVRLASNCSVPQCHNSSWKALWKGVSNVHFWLRLPEPPLPHGSYTLLKYVNMRFSRLK